jgi:hypothetical protein
MKGREGGREEGRKGRSREGQKERRKSISLNLRLLFYYYISCFISISFLYFRSIPLILFIE